VTLDPSRKKIGVRHFFSKGFFLQRKPNPLPHHPIRTGVRPPSTEVRKFKSLRAVDGLDHGHDSAVVARHDASVEARWHFRVRDESAEDRRLRPLRGGSVRVQKVRWSRRDGQHGLAAKTAELRVRHAAVR